MKRRLPVWMMLVASCATGPEPNASRTIEPPATTRSRTIEPPDPKTGVRPSGGDDFVLSRKPKADMPVEDLPIHTSEKWWKYRADFLKVTETQAKERDAAVSEKEPSRTFWDQQTARESVALWTAVCNECHGGRRKLEDALRMPAPPPTWGRGQGLFFGNRRPYSEVFAVIARGGPERNGIPSEMPAWTGKLSREMIWSLLYFLEYQSGGIEGRFPPSLFPRMDEETKKSIQ